MSRPLKVVDLGLTDYEVAHRLQIATVEKIREGAPHDYLFLVEHPAVYTFGRKSKEPTLIVGHGKKVEVERGGEATFHNPGQLVAYPILKLEDKERDVHLFLRRLEDSLILLLKRYGLDSEAVAGATGVWLKKDKKKIASIGVAVRSWITFHGIALNVENDLSGFSAINPCGFSAAIMTSLKAQLGAQCPSLESIKSAYISAFCDIFGRKPLQAQP